MAFLSPKTMICKTMAGQEVWTAALASSLRNGPEQAAMKLRWKSSRGGRAFATAGVTPQQAGAIRRLNGKQNDAAKVGICFSKSTSRAAVVTEIEGYLRNHGMPLEKVDYENELRPATFAVRKDRDAIAGIIICLGQEAAETSIIDGLNGRSFRVGMESITLQVTSDFRFLRQATAAGSMRRAAGRPG